MVGRGASYADIDGDGDQDVVLTQTGGPPRLLRNDQGSDHHWLRVRLLGQPPNPDAVSARVRLEAGGRIQERQVSATRSYLSQTELTLTFGLGKAMMVDRLEIVWPDGERQALEDIPADQELTVSRAAPGPASAGS